MEILGNARHSICPDTEQDYFPPNKPSKCMLSFIKRRICRPDASRTLHLLSYAEEGVHLLKVIDCEFDVESLGHSDEV